MYVIVRLMPICLKIIIYNHKAETETGKWNDFYNFSKKKFKYGR